MKDGSASTSKRVGAGVSSANYKDLSMRGAREEAKTIDAPATASGSAGQAKRGSRTSTSNADLLKQSIRSEKVIKSSLNSKKQKEKDKSSAAAGGQSTASKEKEELKDQADSVVKLVTSESVDGRVATANEEEKTEQVPKSLEEIKTVSFNENKVETSDAATAVQSVKPPPYNSGNSPVKMQEESKESAVVSRPSVRTSVNGNIGPTSANTSGNVTTMQQHSGLMHEDEEEEHFFGNPGNIDQEEQKEDHKRKF